MRVYGLFEYKGRDAICHEVFLAKTYEDAVAIADHLRATKFKDIILGVGYISIAKPQTRDFS